MKLPSASILFGPIKAASEKAWAKGESKSDRKIAEEQKPSQTFSSFLLIRSNQGRKRRQNIVFNHQPMELKAKKMMLIFSSDMALSLVFFFFQEETLAFFHKIRLLWHALLTTRMKKAPSRTSQNVSNKSCPSLLNPHVEAILHKLIGLRDFLKVHMIFANVQLAQIDLRPFIPLRELCLWPK